MILRPPPFDQDTDVLIDWLEFEALSSRFKISSISNLKREWDKRRNSEESDFEEGAGDDEIFIQEVVEGVICRIDIVGESYPFKLSATGEELSLKEILTAANFGYLFCLLLSHANNSAVLNEKYSPQVTNRQRNLFQSLATVAAAGVSGEYSVSFGFPRSDGSNFLDALRAVYARFGEGEVVQSIPKGAPPEAKDAEIDLIAWRSRRDGAGGKYYLLGQVASGQNWRGKSVRNAIGILHTWYFQPPGPVSTATPALFMPYTIPRTSQQETLQERLSYLTTEFGDVYYRFILPDLIKKGMDIYANRPECVDGIRDIPEIQHWTSSEIETMRTLCATA